MKKIVKSTRSTSLSASSGTNPSGVGGVTGGVGRGGINPALIILSLIRLIVLLDKPTRQSPSTIPQPQV